MQRLGGADDHRVRLNWSTTAYATFEISPTGTLTTYTFDFTDLTAVDNAASAVFRFYGWNALSNGSHSSSITWQPAELSRMCRNQMEFG